MENKEIEIPEDIKAWIIKEAENIANEPVIHEFQAARVMGERLYRRLSQERGEGGWISVKDRKPEWGHNVLLHSEFMSYGEPKTEIFVGYLGENGECFTTSDDDYGWTFDECITHWQPLPSPPSPIEGSIKM